MISRSRRLWPSAASFSGRFFAMPKNWHESSSPVNAFEKGMGLAHEKFRRATYITAMAHNNGMLPRKGKGKASPKGEANTAKFQAAIQAAPAIAADPAIDPAYLATPIADFVPHRPARPQK